MVGPPLHEGTVVGNPVASKPETAYIASREEQPMSRLSYALTAGALVAACLGAVAWAQQPAPPPFATTKVEGTDNVYVFRYGNHQSMFVVTSAGVIATDPIGYGPRQPVVTYVDEIKKVSSQPIKYLIYSHHHFDHIAGGKPFKDAGATIVAHKRAKERLGPQGSAHGSAGRDRGCQSDDHARRHDPRAELHRPQPFGQHARHAAAEAEGVVRGRLHPGRNGAGARHDRLLSARGRRLAPFRPG